MEITNGNLINEGTLDKKSLQSFSKDALIQFILKNKQKIMQSEFKYYDPSKQKPYDFTHAQYIKIALKIAYFGVNYQGSEIQLNTKNTIDQHIFNALKRVCLIQDEKKCRYTRCGRTDKGVSAMSNIVSLYVRKLPKNKDTNMESIDYCRCLNGTLPPEIHVLEYCEVPLYFDARFDCLYREYKYFFIEEDYDIELMKNAATKYLGTHNFTYLCKVDTTKTNTSFERTIYEAEIIMENQNSNRALNIYSFRVKGTAFLWHQVRCLVGVLFLIGKHKEKEDIIDYLMDLTACKTRPNYDMAPEHPLVLTDCGFEETDFINSATSYNQSFDKIYVFF